MVEQSGLSGGNDARPGVHARETAAQQPDPLGEVQRDLEAVLKLLQATTPIALVPLGRQRVNKFLHALQSAQREVKRALAATGAGDTGPG